MTGTASEQQATMTVERRLVAELDRWRDTKPKKVDVSALACIPEFQPREASSTRRVDSWHEERETARQIEDFARILDARPSKELEPLLVAEVSGACYVVDGHHRYAAYVKAKRQNVPVRVQGMTKRKAMQLSRLVNVEGRALPLTKGQTAEAVWQHLLDLTDGGRKTLAQVGSSQRAVALAFNIGSKTTVGNMLKRVGLARELREDKDSTVVLSSATGWPTWNAIRRHLIGMDLGEAPSDAVQDAQVRAMATKMARWAEMHSFPKLKAAFGMVRHEMGEPDDDEDDDPMF